MHGIPLIKYEVIPQYSIRHFAILYRTAGTSALTSIQHTCDPPGDSTDGSLLMIVAVKGNASCTLGTASYTERPVNVAYFCCEI
jgi:hypothetical protein